MTTSELHNCMIRQMAIMLDKDREIETLKREMAIMLSDKYREMAIMLSNKDRETAIMLSNKDRETAIMLSNKDREIETLKVENLALKASVIKASIYKSSSKINSSKIDIVKTNIVSELDIIRDKPSVIEKTHDIENMDSKESIVPTSTVDLTEPKVSDLSDSKSENKESYADKAIKAAHLVCEEKIGSKRISSTHELVESTFNKFVAKKILESIEILPKNLSTWEDVRKLALSELKKNDGKWSDTGKFANKLYNKYLVNLDLQKFPIANLPTFDTENRGRFFLQRDQIDEIYETYGEYVDLSGDFKTTKVSDSSIISRAHQCAIEFIFSKKENERET